MIHTTDDNFKTIVLQSKDPSLVLFGSTHCKPCSAMKKSLDSTKFDPFQVVYVDVEESIKTASKYRIAGLPTLLVIDKGKVLDQYLGKPFPYDILKWATKAIKNG